MSEVRGRRSEVRGQKSEVRNSDFEFRISDLVSSNLGAKRLYVIQLTKAFMGKPPGERIDVSETDAQGLISAGIAMAVPADDALNGFVSRLTGSIAESMTKSLDTIIDATLAKFKDVQSPGQEARSSRHLRRRQRRRSQEELRRLALQSRQERPRRPGEGLRQLLQPLAEGGALSEQSGVAGGYIVPPQFYDELLTIAAEQNTFRQAAFVQPMASATLQFPYLDITTVQAAGTSPSLAASKPTGPKRPTRTKPSRGSKMIELKPAHELSRLLRRSKTYSWPTPPSPGEIS